MIYLGFIDEYNKEMEVWENNESKLFFKINDNNNLQIESQFICLDKQDVLELSNFLSKYLNGRLD